jgi:hypothetical protein
MAPIDGVHTTCWGMEYSIHVCPKQHAKEVQSIFAGVDTDGMLIVPTCQQSGMDLVNVGSKVDDEKDRLLEQFVAWSSRICQKLITQGHWADYIDPCSGLPMIHSENNQVYGEVEGLCTLLGYKYVAPLTACILTAPPKPLMWWLTVGASQDCQRWVLQDSPAPEVGQLGVPRVHVHQGSC